MARPRVHQTDDVLDAARDLVIDRGPRAAGMRDIGLRAGAPGGSLYHLFGSRDRLVSQAWLRAVRRFQAGFLERIAIDDAHRAATACASWSVTFALSEPADARLLLTYSPSALLDDDPGADIAAELRTVNERVTSAVADLAVRLHGSDDADAIERVMYAVVDLPCAVVRRHLLAGALSADTAERVASAARLLTEGDLRC